MSDDNWKVHLTGHVFDLEALQELLEPDGWSIKQDCAGQWSIAGPAFECFEQDKDVRQCAWEIISDANVALKLRASTHEPVELASTTTKGRSISVTTKLEGFSIRVGGPATVDATNATTVDAPAPYDRERRWLAAAKKSPEVRAVFELLNSDKDNKEFRAFEPITKDLGNQNEVWNLMGWSKAKIKGFKIVRNNARHEYQLETKMSHDEAVEMARELVMKWLDKSADDLL